MSAAIVFSLWPAPSPSDGETGALGRTCDGKAGRQWGLHCNGATSPAQMAAVCLFMCLLSIGIVVPYAMQGAAVVLAFAAIELVVVGIALLAYVRRGGDAHTLALAGQRRALTEFRAKRVSSETTSGEGTQIDFSGPGRCVQVGHFIRPQQGARLAQKLRHALRSALACPPSAHPV